MPSIYFLIWIFLWNPSNKSIKSINGIYVTWVEHTLNNKRYVKPKHILDIITSQSIIFIIIITFFSSKYDPNTKGFFIFFNTSIFYFIFFLNTQGAQLSSIELDWSCNPSSCFVLENTLPLCSWRPFIHKSQMEYILSSRSKFQCICARPLTK